MDPGGWDGMGWDGMGNILFEEGRALSNILYGKDGALSNILYGKDGARYWDPPLSQFWKKFRKASENFGFCENSEILGILRKF